MEAIVANVDNIKFDIEIALEQQHGALPLPFPGMDKSNAAVCEFYAKGSCAKGTACPLRHVRCDGRTVCKHWLRGLCKKSDNCEFLHQYDITKMEECYFYSNFTACTKKECPFLHIDPESKLKDCPRYDRGFCRHGPNCKYRHVRRVLCMNYLAGLCIEGPECKFAHPRFEHPAAAATLRDRKKLSIVCYFCGDNGHKALFCPKMPQEMRERLARLIKSRAMSGEDGQPLEEVTCYKCGCKGHLANKCPKGNLAFITFSQAQKKDQAQEN